MWYKLAALTTALAVVGAATNGTVKPIEDCPGYEASNVKTSATGLTADLKLAGDACNTYGYDLENLVLSVEYQTEQRLHVKIYDADEMVYQVPSLVVDPPQGASNSSNTTSALKFNYESSPFSFSVERVDSGEKIFDTSAADLVFQSQYLRLRTALPDNPYIYGLGEDSDAFRRNTTNYTRTLWSRDAPGAPPGTNLYGNHPIYFEHREAAGKTHGVFLLNSNGMDIKINNTEQDGQYLEYNTLGGVVDLYFLAGPGPIDVAKQYSEVVGKPAMMAYWHFGFQQCKYGYRDVYTVAEVVYNYTQANIPLETMWTDIDYMDLRKVFTLDPERFPLHVMRDFISYLHEQNQHYVVMVDPAVAKANYGPYNRGVEAGAFLQQNGSVYTGAVWPGPAVFPDWFNPDTQGYWNNEFQTFFSADDGVNIDALWIDMNEASNFCLYPCLNATQSAIDSGNPPDPPPVRTTWDPLPGFPESLQPPSNGSSERRQLSKRHYPVRSAISIKKRQNSGKMMGLPGRDLINPPYQIANVAGSISNKTIDTDIVHDNGLVEYDTHNMYGTMMSSTSRNAMLSRRPTKRPMVITRSTFAGAGAYVGHWLGDNEATWDAYRQSVSQIMAFSGIYQVPMVGADVCGFLDNTTEHLCARWATLGAFYPFYRNHANYGSVDHEFYRWETVAAAARKAITVRYQLLDYFYTAFHQQTQTGAPSLNAMWFLYPNDKTALDIHLQYFYGDSILVSPVTDENSTSVDIYFPADTFYDLYTYAKIQGEAKTVHYDDIPFDTIPLHIRGGAIVPFRTEVANTTAALRQKDFDLIVAPGADGRASGRLYIDDGESLEQAGVTDLVFEYEGGKLTCSGPADAQTSAKITGFFVLGQEGNQTMRGGGKWKGVGNGAWRLEAEQVLGEFTVELI